MLSEETLERLAERLVNRIEELNTFTITKLGNQIREIGTLTPSQVREIIQSVKYGNDLDEIMNKLAEITGKNVNDIYEIFETVARRSQDFAKQFYDYKQIKFIPFDENIILQQQVRAIAKITADEYLNMSKTIAFSRINEKGERYSTDLSTTYQEVIDKAVLNISQGREDYNMVMKQTMRELTDSGIRTVNYASGYSRRLDSSVRMNIMDATCELHNQLQKQFGEEFDADGIEISHVENPAPDHESTIDGKQFSIIGKVTVDGVTYEDFDTVNNSLERHINQYNCRHTISSIVLGISTPLHSKEELEADKKANSKGFEFEGKHYTNYEGTQLQRQLETKIRQYKDRQIGAKSIGDIDEVYHCQEKIGQLTNKYNELSKKSGLPTKIERLRVEGYRRTTKSKEKALSEIKYKDVTKEWLDNATPNSHDVKIDNEFTDIKGVTHPIKDKEVSHLADKNSEEYQKAIDIENILGGDIHLIPRISEINDSGLKTPTPDYFWNNDYWDLKTPTTDGKFETAFERFFKRRGAKKQARKFIVDLKNYSNYTNEEIIELANKTLNNPYRKWINSLVILRDKEVIKIFNKE